MSIVSAANRSFSPQSFSEALNYVTELVRVQALHTAIYNDALHDVREEFKKKVTSEEKLTVTQNKVVQIINRVRGKFLETQQNNKSNLITTVLKDKVAFPEYTLVRNYYEKLEGNTHSLEEIIHDLSAVMISPCRNAVSGMKGPTFIVTYPYSSKTDEKIVSYVLKRTDSDENKVTLIYKEVLQILFSDRCISVPLTSGVDLQKNFFVQPNGEKEEISEDNRLAFTQQIKRLDKTLGDDFFMFAEKVPEANLLDFIQSGWNKLSELQKRSVFKGLGQIALLDMLTGNEDRLVGIWYKGNGGYTLEDALESNLANIMIHFNGEEAGKVYLSLIDNTISSNLQENSLAIEKYLEFLSQCFAKQENLEMIAKHMICMITHEQTPEKNSNEVFLTDLDKFGKESVQEGLQNMYEAIKKNCTRLIERLHSLKSDNNILNRFLIFEGKSEDMVISSKTSGESELV